MCISPQCDDIHSRITVRLGGNRRFNFYFTSCLVGSDDNWTVQRDMSPSDGARCEQAIGRSCLDVFGSSASSYGHVIQDILEGEQECSSQRTLADFGSDSWSRSASVKATHDSPYPYTVHPNLPPRQSWSNSSTFPGQEHPWSQHVLST